MKKVLCFVFTFVTILTSVFCVPIANASDLTPVLNYSFEGSEDAPKLFGNAAIIYDETRKSNVLSLDGTAGTYASLENGFLDSRDNMTISMDVVSYLNDGNFFTFAYGKDETMYNFLRVRGTVVRDAVTVDGYTNEKEVYRDFTQPNAWHNITLVVNGTLLTMYVDGEVTAEVQSKDTGIKTSDFGSDIVAYFGKSFFEDDLYFKGAFDNFKVYDKALTPQEVVESIADSLFIANYVTIGTLNSDAGISLPGEYKLDGTDDHTAVTSTINRVNGEINSYIRKGTNLSSVPVKFNSAIIDDCVITVDGALFNNGDCLDLNFDRSVKLTYKDREESYIIKVPVFAYNPVLPGQYADPDIDYFDGKYWIFPTTDGKYWWTADVFHAFSSTDLVNWTDEGVILDTNSESKPSINDKGIEIGVSPWSTGGSAWAPTIEAKNEKYYLYYVACIRDDLLDTYGVKYNETNWWNRAIGVAVADSPVGPYVPADEPVAYPKVYSSLIADYSGEQIDPAIFTDDDGSSYLLTGGSCVAFMAKLNDDMTTVDNSTVRRVDGMEDFLESFYIFKRNGLYHFTWSCYGTNGEDYTVKYATAYRLDGNLSKASVLLTKDIKNDLLCTAHQSFIYRKDIDECLIAYHRFFTPLYNYPTGLGFHRETCIERVYFNTNGTMKPIKPTMYGAGRVDANEYNVILENDSYAYTGQAIEPVVRVTDKSGNTISSKCYTVNYSSNKNAGNGAVKVTFKNNLVGEITKYFSIVKQDNSEAQTPSVTVTTTSSNETVPTTVTATSSTSSTDISNVTNGNLTTTLANESSSTAKASASKPKKASIKKLIKGKKQIKVTWKKISGVSGYQIQCSTDKKFKKKTITKTVKGNKKTSLIIKKLKLGKKYYVRIRAYKKYKDNGKTKSIYGSWSSVKTVKTK